MESEDVDKRGYCIFLSCFRSLLVKNKIPTVWPQVLTFVCIMFLKTKKKKEMIRLGDC